MKQLILLLILIGPFTTYAQLKEVWKTDQILDVPESVKYYHEGNCLFVSNVAGKPSDKDGNGFISKLTCDGQVIKMKWVDGLDAPKGMAIRDGILYVSNIDELVLIDIEKARVIKRVKQPEASFLNDVTITKAGDVLVSDSGTSTVYQLKEDQLIVWLKDEKLGRLNGLLAEKDYVLVGTGKRIVKVDLKSKKSEVFLETGAQVDGLEADGLGAYYYTFWRGEMYYYKPGEAPVQLLNTAEKNIQSADIGLIPATQEILVPTFFDNRVVAYIMD